MAMDRTQKTRVVIAATVVQAAVASVTVRDINRRPAESVRGPKGLWRLIGSVNTLGSLAYWIVGRRR